MAKINPRKNGKTRAERKAAAKAARARAERKAANREAVARSRRITARTAARAAADKAAEKKAAKAALKRAEQAGHAGSGNQPPLEVRSASNPGHSPIPENPKIKVPLNYGPRAEEVLHDRRAAAARAEKEAAGIKPKAAVEKVIADRAAVKQEPAKQAAAKELRGPELLQQKLEVRQAATARREAESRRRLSLSPEEAAREQRLPHSDAALEHLAERTETEKWQRQVLLELEGKNKPKLTLYKGDERYEETTSAKDRKVHKQRFHDEMKRLASIAPEELMFERAELAKENKRLGHPGPSAQQAAKRAETTATAASARQAGSVGASSSPPASVQQAGSVGASSSPPASVQQAGSVGASSSSPASVQQASSTRTPPPGTPDLTFDLSGRTTVPEFNVSSGGENFNRNTIYLDLETTGLRTKSFNVLNVDPRKTVPGITEVATFYREGGSTTAKPVEGLTGYTKVVPRDVLDNIDESTMKQLTQGEKHGIGSRFDEGILQDGKLRSIFMDYVEASQTGKYKGTDIPVEFREVEDYVKSFKDLMRQAGHGGAGSGVLTGWNIGFDVNMMLDTAKAVDKQNGTDLAGDMIKLLDDGSVEVKDLDDPLRKYMFHQTMTGTARPEHLSRAAMNEALQSAGDTSNAVKAEILDDIAKHGKDGYSSKYVGVNEPLQQLGEDVRAYEQNKNVFKERLTKTLKEKRPMLGQYNIGAAEQKAIDNIAKELSTVADAQPVGEGYEAFKVATRNLRQMVSGAKAQSEAELYKELIGGAYTDATGRQTLIGSVVPENTHLPWRAAEKLTTALDYVGGRTQDIIADLMGHPMAAAAHVAVADIPMGAEMSSNLETIVDSAIKGDEASTTYMDDIIRDSRGRRQIELAEDVLQMETSHASRAAGAATGAGAMDSAASARSSLSAALRKVGGWKGVAAGAAAGYLAYELFSGPDAVEGVRQSFSQYDQEHGINQGSMQSGVTTPFGSGRDTRVQLLTAEVDSKNAKSARFRREAISEARTSIHGRINPVAYDASGKWNRGDLRSSLENIAGGRNDERVILPEPPPPRPDQAFSDYSLAAQAQFVESVQSRSHSSVAEHPDHDHRSAGIIASPVNAPSVRVPSTGITASPVNAPILKPSMTGSRVPEEYMAISSVGDLSPVSNGTTIKSGVGAAITPPPPPMNIPVFKNGNSKVRDQGAKSFLMPPTAPGKPTTNQSRFIRSGGQE